MDTDHNKQINTEPNNTDNSKTQTGESQGVAVNIFAILGFIAILVAGLWAAVQLVKQVSNFSLDLNKPSVSLSLFGQDNADSALEQEKDEDTLTESVTEPDTEAEESAKADTEPATVADRNNNVNQTPQTRTVRTVVPVRTSDPNGMPDLAVSVTNVTTNKDTDITTVRIEVANQGTKLAEGWILSAVLPTEPAYTYTSAPQQALYAGEKAEMLLTFSKTKSGMQSLVITVDPNNAIAESLETNNTVELKLVN